MKSIVCLLVLFIVPLMKSNGQVCFPDSACFFISGGSFDTIYAGAEKGQSMEYCFRKASWRDKYYSAIKKYSNSTLTELELLYARLWNERISKESRDSSSFMNLQIDLIVFLQNCKFTMPEYSEPIRFLYPGYLIFCKDFRRIIYRRTKNLKESNLRKLAILDHFMKSRFNSN